MARFGRKVRPGRKIRQDEQRRGGAAAIPLTWDEIPSTEAWWFRWFRGAGGTLAEMSYVHTSCANVYAGQSDVRVGVEAFNTLDKWEFCYRPVFRFPIPAGFSFVEAKLRVNIRYVPENDFGGQISMVDYTGSTFLTSDWDEFGGLDAPLLSEVRPDIDEYAIDDWMEFPLNALGKTKIIAGTNLYLALRHEIDRTATGTWASDQQDLVRFYGNPEAADVKPRLAYGYLP